MNETKKKYTAEGLLQFAYKHNQIPVVVFAKDKDLQSGMDEEQTLVKENIDEID